MTNQAPLNPTEPHSFEPNSFTPYTTPPAAQEYTPEPPARGGKARKVWGWILIGLGILIALSNVARLRLGTASNSGDSVEQITYSVLAIGVPLVLLIVGIRLVRKKR